MDSEKNLFIDTLKNSQEYYNMFMKTILPNLSMKSNELSIMARKEGNNGFLKKPHTADQHKAILELYSESVACAENDSEELACAYGNRSAFLQHLKKYQSSVEDIDRALRITRSEVFRIKLLCRKAECLKSMSNNKQSSDALEEAKENLEMLPAQDEPTKKKLSELIGKAESFAPTNKANSTPNSTTPKKKKLKMEDFESVTLNRDDKYGRYLTATRDIQAGEIVYAEKYYAACLSHSKRYSHCENCFEYCYSLIPCDSCDWAMYCSEACKLEALDGYHEVECGVMPLIGNISEESLFESKVPVRLLVRGLKEAGGVEELRRMMESQEDENDSDLEDLLAGRKFERKFAFVNKLKSIFKTAENECMSVIGIFILLLKHEMFFDVDSPLDSVDDLTANENVVFLGSLFLKIWGVKNVNCYMLSKASSTCNHPNEVGELHQRNYCMAMGTGMALVSSLINHSCIPNVGRIVSDEQKLVLFALRPIQENEQLFDCYHLPFYNFPKDERRDFFETFQFTCDCKACVDNWPVYDFSSIQLSYNNLKIMKKEMELTEEIKKIEKVIFNDNMQDYSKMIQDLSNLVTKAITSLGQQNAVTCRFYFLLREAFERSYGMKPENIRGCKASNK